MSLAEATWEEVAAQAVASPDHEPCCYACGRPLSDFTVSDVGKRHAGASKTEKAAAYAQQPRSGTARARVLDAIVRAGGEGRTDEELSLELRMRLYTAAPRRNELVIGGWLRDSGRVRETSTGSDATVWVLTDAAWDRFANRPGCDRGGLHD